MKEKIDTIYNSIIKVKSFYENLNVILNDKFTGKYESNFMDRDEHIDSTDAGFGKIIEKKIYKYISSLKQYNIKLEDNGKNTWPDYIFYLSELITKADCKTTNASERKNKYSGNTFYFKNKKYSFSINRNNLTSNTNVNKSKRGQFNLYSALESYEIIVYYIINDKDNFEIINIEIVPVIFLNLFNYKDGISFNNIKYDLYKQFKENKYTEFSLKSYIQSLIKEFQ